MDVTTLFNLATGFTRMQNNYVRVGSRFGLLRCGFAKVLGFFAHMLTLAAFKILPRSENEKLPMDLVRKELIDMATAPIPRRNVDHLNAELYPAPQFHPITLDRAPRKLVDTDMKEMMTSPRRDKK